MRQQYDVIRLASLRVTIWQEYDSIFSATKLSDGKHDIWIVSL